MKKKRQPLSRQRKSRPRRFEGNIDASGYGLKIKGGFNTNSARVKKNVSPCTLCYARSLADPFSGPAACIPDYPVMLSRRAKFFAKGFFQTGTLGTGFVVCSPEYGAISDVPIPAAPNSAAVRYTTAAYALADVQVNGAATLAAFTNSDYQAADFGANAVLAEYRVVSAGLRVRYFGTELNMGGGYVALMEPQHQTVHLMTIPTIKGYIETQTFPVADKRPWVHVLYKPVLNNDSIYKDVFPACTFTAVDFNYYMIIIAIAPDPAVSLTFEWEFFGNYEFSGRNIQGKVVSEFDPVGYGAVCSATATSQVFKPSLTSSVADESAFASDVSKSVNLSSGF